MGREWAADHLERMLRQEEIYRTRKEIRGAHDHPESRLYRIVVTSGTMLAVLNAEKRPEEQEVRHLFVAKHVREQRIGSELLEEFEAWADDSLPTIVDVIPSNRAAQRLYRRRGFHVLGDSQPEWRGLEIIRMRRETDA